MTIYADILVVVNFIVDFFLLLAATRLLRRGPKTVRLILGGLLGGFASCVIFLPPLHIFTDIVIRLAICLSMSLIAFGYESLRFFIRAAGTVLILTCGYGGIMAAIWSLFRPHGMAVVRSVVYFDISPFFLVAATVGFYLLFTGVSYVFHKRSVTAQNCEVTVIAAQNQIKVKGLLDTGNSLEDTLESGEVLIGDRACVAALFGENPFDNSDYRHRYRLIPCGTVSGGGMLEAYRCDSARIQTDGRSVTLHKPLLAISKVPIGEESMVLINPEIFSV